MMHKADLLRLSALIVSLHNLARSNGYPSDLVHLHGEAQATYNAYEAAHVDCAICD